MLVRQGTRILRIIFVTLAFDIVKIVFSQQVQTEIPTSPVRLGSGIECEGEWPVRRCETSQFLASGGAASDRCRHAGGNGAACYSKSQSVEWRDW
mmetsp:Transcript_8624/g.24035  ORF Transcript_8624/g.24035 Transcript_8624/m.24035 type:complete len:95 (+) Transcript_8624:2166-2450(+)